MKRKVYFVLGGESTGTRLITRLLVDAGCFGDVDHAQRIDEWAYRRIGSLEERLKKGQPLVWRRSFPHGKRMPNVMEDLVDPVFRLYGVNHDDDVLFLVTMRNWVCAAKSAVKAAHSTSYEEAINKLKDAYVRIFTFLGQNPLFDYRVVHYEWLTSWRPFALTSLYQDCGLNVKHDRIIEIADTLINANDKWLKECVDEQSKQ